MNPTSILNGLNTLYALLIPAAIAYVLLFYAFAWKRPWLALLLIFATAPIQNDLSGGDGGARFSIAEINLLLTLPLLLLKGRRWHIGPIAIPVFAYLFVCLVSSVLSPRETTLTSMLQMVLYLVVTVVVFATLARDERDYLPALKALVWVGVVFALLSLSGLYERFNLNKNGVGASLASCLVVCAELWFGAKKIRRKTSLALCFGLISLGLLMTLSRGAWLSAAVGLVVLCAIRGQYGLLLRATALAIPLALVVWMMLPQKSKSYVTGFDARKNYNIMLRYKALNFAQDKFEESPILGVGVGLRKEYDATNVVMLTLAETGIVGLAAFAWVHFSLLALVWKSKKKLKRNDPLFPFVALAGALVVGRLAHGMVDHYWSRGAITSAWAAVGMATYVHFALRRRARETQRAHDEYQSALWQGARETRRAGLQRDAFPIASTQSSTRFDAATVSPGAIQPFAATPNETLRQRDVDR